MFTKMIVLHKCFVNCFNQIAAIGKQRPLRHQKSAIWIWVLSFWFEVALMHIPYRAEFINRNQRIGL